MEWGWGWWDGVDGMRMEWVRAKYGWDGIWTRASEETSALNWRHRPLGHSTQIQFWSWMLATGIEPATVGLLDQCSTDWATRATQDEMESIHHFCHGIHPSFLPWNGSIIFAMESIQYFCHGMGDGHLSISEIPYYATSRPQGIHSVPSLILARHSFNTIISMFEGIGQHCHKITPADHTSTSQSAAMSSTDLLDISWESILENIYHCYKLFVPWFWSLKSDPP